MTGTPGERRHTCVHIVTTSLCHLQDGGHAEAGTCVGVVLDDNILLVCLDTLYNLAQANGSTYTCHVLQADFVCTGINELLGKINVVLHGVYGAVGDAQRSLCYHACLLGILDGGDYVAHIVQTAEDTGNVSSLSLLHLVEEFAEILGAWAHAQAVQCTVQHVCLYACLAERLCPFAHALVGILAIEQVHLFKTTAVCLHTVKAAHTDDGRGYLQKLVYTRLVLACTLPHIAEDQTKLYFFHIVVFFLSNY